MDNIYQLHCRTLLYQECVKSQKSKFITEGIAKFGNRRMETIAVRRRRKRHQLLSLFAELNNMGCFSLHFLNLLVSSIKK